MNVALYSQKVKKDFYPYLEEIFTVFEECDWTPILEKRLKIDLVKIFPQLADCKTYESHEDFKSGIDLAISMGGDGTFLQMVGYVKDSNVPIVGINTGRLGFMSNVSKNHIREALTRIKESKYTLQDRSLLEIETKNHLFGDDNFAFNELTIHKKDSASMISIRVELDGKYMNAYWADGLIVSTPTGSTAYSLSCGGPIVTPGCMVHIITPIAPHNLNVRPVLIPDFKEIRLVAECRSKSLLLTLDSRSKIIKNNYEIIVRKAKFSIKVIQFEDYSFVDTIRDKLLWGLDKRN